MILLQTRHLKPSWSRLWQRDLSSLLRALAFDLGYSSVIDGKALILRSEDSFELSFVFNDTESPRATCCASNGCSAICRLFGGSSRPREDARPSSASISDLHKVHLPWYTNCTRHLEGRLREGQYYNPTHLRVEPLTLGRKTVSSSFSFEQSCPSCVNMGSRIARCALTLDGIQKVEI